MKIHEFQGKEILRKHGVTTLPGGVARKPDEAVAVAKMLGGEVADLGVVVGKVHLMTAQGIRCTLPVGPEHQGVLTGRNIGHIDPVAGCP